MAQGFQRNIPGQDPATYINRGTVTPQNNWQAQAVQGVAQNIASPIKTGIGLGMGERIMNDTLDKVLSVTTSPGETGQAQSIGLDGSVNQFDAQGNKIGESAPVDPRLSGDARTRAIQESTRDFNKEATKVKRAYEAGLMTDREYYARLEMNLRKAENTYPMFKEEISQQARAMLTDELHYFHYQSAVGKLAANREQQEAQQSQQQEWQMGHIQDIAKYYGLNPNLVANNYPRFSAKYGQDVQMDLQRDALKDDLTIQKGKNTVSDHERKLADRAMTRMAQKEANTYLGDAWDDGRDAIIDTLGTENPENIHIDIAAASVEERVRIKADLEQRKQAKIQEYRSNYPNIDVESHVERISTTYDDAINSVDNPSVWQQMKDKDTYMEVLARDSLGFKMRQMSVMAETMSGLGQPVQVRVFNTLNESGAVDLVADQLNNILDYDPSQISDDGDLEETSALNRQLTEGLVNYSLTADGDDRKETSQELALNALASEQRNIQELRTRGSRDANAAQRNTIRTITKLFGMDPEVLQQDTEAARMLREQGNRNIDDYLLSASNAATRYIGSGELTGVRVNPSNGLVKLVGDDTNRPTRAGRRPVSQGRLAGDQRSDGQRFVDDINKAIMAKAALSGDTSVSNVREISQMITNQMGAAVGDEAGIRSYIAQSAPAYGIDPDLALRIANQESRFKPDAFNEKSGASGIFQLTQGGGAADVGMDWEKRFDPVTSVQSGLQYYKKVRDQYIPNLIGADNETDQEILATMAYNMGIGELVKYVRGERDDIPKETKLYIKETHPGKTWTVVDTYRNRYLYDNDNGPEDEGRRMRRSNGGR